MLVVLITRTTHAAVAVVAPARHYVVVADIVYTAAAVGSPQVRGQPQPGLRTAGCCGLARLCWHWPRQPGPLALGSRAMPASRGQALVAGYHSLRPRQPGPPARAAVAGGGGRPCYQARTTVAGAPACGLGQTPGLPTGWGLRPTAGPAIP